MIRSQLEIYTPPTQETVESIRYPLLPNRIQFMTKYMSAYYIKTDIILYRIGSRIWIVSHKQEAATTKFRNTTTASKKQETGTTKWGSVNRSSNTAKAKLTTKKQAGAATREVLFE